MGKLVGSSMDESSKYLRILLCGRPKVGKTLMSATFPKPVILNADRGLASLSKRGIKVPTITMSRMTVETKGSATEINSWKHVHELVVNLKNKKGRFWDELSAYKPETLVIDSLSALSEIFEAEVLADPVIAGKKAGEQWLDLKDYGVIYARMYNVIGEFKDIPMHFVATTGIESFSDDTGKVIEIPSMTGNKLGQRIPHVFNDVLMLETREEKGKISYWASPIPTRTQPYLGTRALDIEEAIQNPSFEKLLKTEKGKK